MNEPIVAEYPELAALAAEVRQLLAAGEQFGRQGAEQYRRVGLKLLKIKELCGHGAWLKWLADNVQLSERQAQNYMRLAKSAESADLMESWRIISGLDDDEPETTLEEESSDDSPSEPLPLGDAIRKTLERWMKRAELEDPELIPKIKRAARLFAD